MDRATGFYPVGREFESLQSHHSKEYMFICKHCKKEFERLSPANKANHSRWCTENPKRIEYAKKLISAREGIKNPRNQFVKAKDEGRTIVSVMKGKPSTRKDYKHTPESLEKIREKALLSDHRRLVKSTRYYTQVDGTQVLLDSSWEESLARRLDSLGVAWTRPKNPIKWVDGSGKIHNYFPDFYLPDQDLYLDPKNPHAAMVQKEKLDVIKILLPNLKIITTLKECEEFVV